MNVPQLSGPQHKFLATPMLDKDVCLCFVLQLASLVKNAATTNRP